MRSKVGPPEKTRKVTDLRFDNYNGKCAKNNTID
jgi:hypothetical protein